MRQNGLFRWSESQQRHYEICGELAPGGGVCESEAGTCESIHLRHTIAGHDHVPATESNQRQMVSWIGPVPVPSRAEMIRMMRKA